MSYEPDVDGEEVAETRRRRASDIATQQRQNDIAAAMRHPATVRVLCDILGLTGYHGDPMRDDPYRAAYAMGRRSVGVELMDLVERHDSGAHRKLLDAAAETRAKINEQVESET